MANNLEFNNGWQEAVIVVSDLNRIAKDLEIVGDWKVLAEGDLEQEQLKLWYLNDNAKGKYKLVRNPDTSKGYLRFIQLDNIEQEQIRPSGQIWESGGIFDLNFRVTDIEDKYKKLLARGWTAYNDPTEYDFGPVTVSEVLMVGPDGVCFALIERIAPPLEENGEPYAISRTFNSTMIVRDIDKSFKFFKDKLGFNTVMEVLGHRLEAGPNVLGLAHNIVPNHAMNVYIVHPNGVTDGSIELLKLDDLDGRNFTPNAKPYNLGITSLRFPVTNIEEQYDDLKEKDVKPVYEPTILEMKPYGKVKIFALELPEGGWVEYFEPLN